MAIELSPQDTRDIEKVIKDIKPHIEADGKASYEKSTDVEYLAIKINEKTHTPVESLKKTIAAEINKDPDGFKKKGTEGLWKVVEAQYSKQHSSDVLVNRTAPSQSPNQTQQVIPSASPASASATAAPSRSPQAATADIKEQRIESLVKYLRTPQNGGISDFQAHLYNSGVVTPDKNGGLQKGNDLNQNKFSDNYALSKLLATNAESQGRGFDKIKPAFEAELNKVNAKGPIKDYTKQELGEAYARIYERGFSAQNSETSKIIKNVQSAVTEAKEKSKPYVSRDGLNTEAEIGEILKRANKRPDEGADKSKHNHNSSSNSDDRFKEAAAKLQLGVISHSHHDGGRVSAPAIDAGKGGPSVPHLG